MELNEFQSLQSVVHDSLNQQRCRIIGLHTHTHMKSDGTCPPTAMYTGTRPRWSFVRLIRFAGFRGHRGSHWL